MKFNSVEKLCEAIVSGEGVVQLDFPGAGRAACIFLLINGSFKIFRCIVKAET